MHSCFIQNIQQDILKVFGNRYSQPTMEQRALKESYAWEANRRTASIGEEAMGLLQSKFNVKQNLHCCIQYTELEEIRIWQLFISIIR